MCGAAAWAFRSSSVAHFSMKKNASGPSLVCSPRPVSASSTGPYSMQPFSAWTAGTLALKFASTSARLPGLAVMMATTWIMVFSL